MNKFSNGGKFKERHNYMKKYFKGFVVLAALVALAWTVQKTVAGAKHSPTLVATGEGGI